MERIKTTDGEERVRYPKTDKGFLEVMQTCLEYIWEQSREEQTETTSYMLNLTNAMVQYRTYGLVIGWDELASSGVFHDAIGKVTDVTTNYVEVTEDY